MFVLAAFGGCGSAGAPDAGAHDAAAPARAASTATASSSGGNGVAAALPGYRDLAAAPQPEFATLAFAPVVTEFAPGEIVLNAPTLELEIRRVAYGPYGVTIDLEARQKASDLQTFLNAGDKGMLRDDAGGAYRLREDAHMLSLYEGKRGDTWRATIEAHGFVPAAARNMTLTLNVAAFRAPAALVEASWQVPQSLAAQRRLHDYDLIEPARSWRFAEPRSAMSQDGTLGVRVYAVIWLRDGIALDMELVNGLRNGGRAIHHARLVDDHGRISRHLAHKEARGSVISLDANGRQVGRFLFKPQIAPDAGSLKLEIGNGSYMVTLDLGAIPPAAQPGFPMPAETERNLAYIDFHEEPVRLPMPTSRLDRVAELKRDLDAADGETGTRIDLPGDVLFDFDKATLRADADATLDKLAELITRLDRTARITGYTDAKGQAAYNQKLSEERAHAVRSALVARKVPAERIAEVRGRGAADPKAPNTHANGSDDPVGRARNRRVEVLIEPAHGG